MTDPTPQAPSQGLTDERLLELAEKELCVNDIQDSHEHRYYIELLTDELLAFARAAIAADRAARVELVPPQELTDKQLLELADGEIEADDVLPMDEYEAANDRALEVYRSELIAVMHAAIAAHEAARPAPAPVPTFLDAIRLANGCHDYSGGYLCEAADVYHAGITTVVNVLRKAAVGPWDSQTNAVFAMGSACLKTPAPTPEDVETRFRAWWAESFPNAPAGPHAVRSHVAFALHLMGGEVAA